MIKALIFSKDRSMQLDLLLRSIHLNCPNLFDFTIIYKWSNEEFLLGYNYLRARSPVQNIKWIPEVNLQQDIMTTLETNQRSHFLTCLFTDDCIFYRKCDKTYEYFSNLFELYDGLLTFSFRLGENTIVQNYTTGEVQPPLFKYNPKQINDVLTWNYNLCYDQFNSGYCFSHDGHIYRSSDLYRMIAKFEQIPTLRVIEGALSQRKNRQDINRNYMACFHESCVVNVPVNTAQQDQIYLGSKQRFTLEELNQKYIDGEYLALDKMDFSGIIGAHQEVEYKFNKE